MYSKMLCMLEDEQSDFIEQVWFEFKTTSSHTEYTLKTGRRITFLHHSVIPFEQATGIEAGLLQAALMESTHGGKVEFILKGSGFNQPYFKRTPKALAALISFLQDFKTTRLDSVHTSEKTQTEKVTPDSGPTVFSRFGMSIDATTGPVTQFTNLEKQSLAGSPQLSIQAHVRIFSRIDELKQFLEVLLVDIFDGYPGVFFQRNKLMEERRSHGQ